MLKNPLKHLSTTYVFFWRTTQPGPLVANYPVLLRGQLINSMLQQNSIDFEQKEQTWLRLDLKSWGPASPGWWCPPAPPPGMGWMLSALSTEENITSFLPSAGMMITEVSPLLKLLPHVCFYSFSFATLTLCSLLTRSSSTSRRRRTWCFGHLSLTRT